MEHKQGQYYLLDYIHNTNRIRWKVKLFSPSAKLVIVERLPGKEPVLLIGVPITALKPLKEKQ